MTAAHLIDGKKAAAELNAKTADTVAHLARAHGVTPGLAVVLVGDNPASAVYVRNKVKQTEAAGMRSIEHRLGSDIAEADLLALIARLNADDAVDGILVQLPLPAQIDAGRVIEAIDPAKDVDGFHPVNAGRLAIGADSLVPCTPLGCLILIKSLIADLSGRDAVIIGRSNIVGKPMALLLLQENCTVTIAHSRTRELPDACRRADILVAAVGKPGLVRGDWVKPGAIVIDVGINRVIGADGKAALIGDVAFGEAAAVAGAITPVPGGVGPMTIACLLANTLKAAIMRRGVASASLPA